MATPAYTDTVCFSFKEDNFRPLKQSSSADVSNSDNQSKLAHKVGTHKSVNSFAAHKPVNFASST